MPQAWQSWMKHDIDAWCGSATVQDMTDAEYRGYHNLLMAQFQSEDGMLPDDDKALAKLSRKRAEWPQIREHILEQFEKGGEGRIFNPRCYKEWLEAMGLSEKRSKGGKATAGKRWAKTPPSESAGVPPATAQGPDSPAIAQQEDSNSPATAVQPVITERNVTLRNKEHMPAGAAQERTRKPTSDELDLVYRAYPRLVGRAKALDEIGKAVYRLAEGGTLPPMTTGTALQFLRGKASEFARSPAGQQGEFTPHPSTWFHQERYFDNEQEWQRSGDGGRSDGADRQREGKRQRARTAAEERHHEGLGEIASAFPELASDRGHGAVDGRGEAELLQPNGSTGMGRVYPITLDGNRPAPWDARSA